LAETLNSRMARCPPGGVGLVPIAAGFWIFNETRVCVVTAPGDRDTVVFPDLELTVPPAAPTMPTTVSTEQLSTCNQLSTSTSG
jgi:hypothetical protein